MYTIFGWVMCSCTKGDVHHLRLGDVLLHLTVPVAFHHFPYLGRGDLAVLRGKQLDLVSRVLHGTGLMGVDVSRGGRKDALPGTEGRGNDGEVGLSGTLHEVDGGSGKVQMLPDLFRCLLAPEIQSVSVVSLVVMFPQRLQDQRMGTAVIVIVKSVHGNCSLL